MTGRLVIMGSGESAPTMVKVHRALIEEAGPGARAMLDTPFGFQANADDLTDKLLEYFSAAVGVPLEVARWRRRAASTRPPRGTGSGWCGRPRGRRPAAGPWRTTRGRSHSG